MNKASVVANLCKSCGFCVKFCPKKVIAFGDKRNSKGHYYPVIDVEGCIGCGTCAIGAYDQECLDELLGFAPGPSGEKDYECAVYAAPVGRRKEEK